MDDKDNGLDSDSDSEVVVEFESSYDEVLPEISVLSRPKSPRNKKMELYEEIEGENRGIPRRWLKLLKRVDQDKWSVEVAQKSFG